MNLAWPIDKIYVTQLFGKNPKIYAKFGMHGHNGIDLRTRFIDSPLGHRFATSAADGVVIEVNTAPKMSGYGIFVRVEHEGGAQTIYAHLMKTYVVRGERVKTGRRLGLTDNTGYSSGSHLHFGFRPANWRSLYNNGFLGYVSPIPFLPKV